MGLSISVGLGAEVREDGDDETLAYLEDQFEVINDLLESFGLPAHREPYDLKADQTLALDMFGYSGLHYLRRVAAHLALGEELPPPGDEEAASDPVLAEYYRLYDEHLAEGKAAEMRFQHLIMHSDVEGFYLPADFPEVIHADPSLEVTGDLIGSAPRLLAECLELAAALELPADLDPESDEVWEAAESQGDGEVKWQRYGIESHTCLALIRACRASVGTGAALVFN